jgi:hypothetical protein
MAISEAFGRRRSWGQIGSKAKARMLRAVQSQALYWVTKRYKRAIIPLALEMKISPKKLRGHLENLLKAGVKQREIPDRMIQDLETLRELRMATKVEPERWNRFLKDHSLAEAMQEMQQHAQAMGQAQQHAGSQGGTIRLPEWVAGIRRGKRAA